MRTIWSVWVAAWLLLALAGAGQTRVTLVGLDPAAVEKRIGAPAEKEELADSNEAYWIYKTKSGTLSVHFQNAVVVDIDPADFPIDTILK